MGAVDHILEIKHISKFYPGVAALKDVSLKVQRGEVHALVGENGAGKSTLIKTCSGAIAPSKGELVVNGKTFRSMTPALAEEHGIGVIYQEFNLVGDLSAAENIFLGRAIRKGILVDRKAMERESKKILDSLQIAIDPHVLVKTLSVGYRQMVEIARAVSQNTALLIMDEPSAPLTSAEVESMFAMVGQLKENGVTIIYISHRLDEIFRVSDRITVLRDGRHVTTLATRDTNKIEYAGVCGSDLHYYKTGEIGANIVRPPFVLGHEAGGEVVAVGGAVTHLKTGDKVALEPGKTCGKCKFCKSGRYNLCPDVIFFATPPIDGVFQEYVVHPADLCFKIPEHMNTMEAALIEPLAVGLYAVRQGGAKVKEVVASGGIVSKNPLLMQIYADVLGVNIKIAASDQAAALGSAIYAALTAGAKKGGV